MAWTEIVGRRFSATELETYVRAQQFSTFRPKFVVVHNTAVPAVKDRPHGFTPQHMLNLVAFYRGKGWSAGPHAFVDQNGTWIFTPITAQGVHSPSWNGTSLGVETLGDYESERFEDPIKGNLLDCLTVLHDVLGLDPHELRLHREDVQTSHKTCPGKNLNRRELVDELTQRLLTRRTSAASISV